MSESPPTTTPSHDAALGALLGAFVGDAAGAVLEFLGHIPTSTEVHHALTMPGGGILGVAPGQITDDGELTLALARALAERNVASPSALAQAQDDAAASYVRWYRSAPFDIGGTTTNALGLGGTLQLGQVPTGAEMQAVSEHLNMGSKANGSLMRATPLGVWGHALPIDQLSSLARSDSALTHPNPSCTDAVACYAIAIAHLVRSPGDREGALHATTTWATEHACDEVRTWLDDAIAGIEVPGHPLAGFIRIAFIHAFGHLAKGTAYVDAIEQTLAIGGDTDTNACIVGGLIGAAVGAEAIPGPLRSAVMGAKTQLGNPRPPWLSPRDTPALVRRLLGATPTHQ